MTAYIGPSRKQWMIKLKLRSWRNVRLSLINDTTCTRPPTSKLLLPTLRESCPLIMAILWQTWLGCFRDFPLSFIALLTYLTSIMYTDRGHGMLPRCCPVSHNIGGKKALYYLALVGGDMEKQASKPIQAIPTEGKIKVCTWLQEISSCSWLTVLPGPA